jgi:hypothetical protein
MLKIEKDNEGKIKDFAVTDPYHLYVQAIQASNGNLLRKEAVAIGSLDELDELMTRVDPDDGMILGKKWAINDDVIKALKENGDCIHYPFGGVIRFEYFLKPMRYKDELTHKG